jgi:TrmH family RNA methyltransferase
MSLLISSLQNPKVKDVIRLGKRGERETRRETVVEGVREVSLALDAGIVPNQAFICPELAWNAEARRVEERLRNLSAAHRRPLYEVTQDVFAKLAVRGDSGGIVLVIPYPQRSLQTLRFKDAPFLIAVEGAEKPGNLGAILRTADAAGVDAVIACDGTDLHNPNVVRASLGALFTVPAVETASNEAIAWLRRRGIDIIASSPDADLLYSHVDLTGPVALVLGSEAEGLSAIWLDAADQRVRIPMFGRVDSLNLAGSAAILAYEVVRQRLPRNAP